MRYDALWVFSAISFVMMRRRRYKATSKSMDVQHVYVLCVCVRVCAGNRIKTNVPQP